MQVELSKVVDLGIDPGLTGAIAIYNVSQDNLVGMLDLSTYFKGRELDLYGLMKDIRKPFIIRNVFLEKQGVRPKQGAVSGALIVGIFRALQGLFIGMGHRVIIVQPGPWKASYGLIKKDKKASIKKALELFPNWELALKEPKQHNRAEAALISRLGVL